MLTQRRVLDIRGDHDKYVLAHGATLVAGVPTRLILSGRWWVSRQPSSTRGVRNRSVAKRCSLVRVAF